MNVKKKGNRGENNWASWLRSHGIKAYKDAASGGGSWEKGDVGNNINAHFEVKTVKRLGLQEAWRQSTKDSGPYDTPYVIIHFDGMAPDDWLVVMDNHSWLDLWKRAQEPKTTSNSREMRWKVEKAVQALKTLLKEYE